MDWSQVSIGAIAGGFATWLGGLLKTWFEHVLEERKQRALEEGRIRSERREEDRRQAERKREAAEKRANDGAELLLLKRKLQGCKDIRTAAPIVSKVHEFFERHPHYASQRAYSDFVALFPHNFFNQVCSAASLLSLPGLEELLRMAELLEVPA